MAHKIDYTLVGDDMQAVVIELDSREVVRAEAGALLYMDPDISMDTTASGGIMGGLKRSLAGESFFITSFANTGGGKARVAFAAPYPGKIVSLDLSKHQGEFLCQKDAYLCSAEGIDISIALTRRLGAGVFGGEGFILQRLVGDGWAFLHAGGTVVERELAPGEKVRVDTGCLVGFSSTVDYDIQFVGGFKNAMFGGEGLFLATITGPGLAYLQTLPFSRLADRIVAASRFSGRKGERKGIAGLGGGLLGRILSGDGD